MTAPKECEQLFRQVQSKCPPEAVIDILSLEDRWEDLLDYARNHANARAFPNMIRRLRNHFPEACFDLYRQVVLNLAESGTGQNLYKQIASHAIQLRDIPGHEEPFGKFMAEFMDTYARRPSLISTLGDLAELGRQWKARQREAGIQALTPERLKAIDLGELAQYCPIDPAQVRDQAPRLADGQWSNAALNWAILIKLIQS